MAERYTMSVILGSVKSVFSFVNDEAVVLVEHSVHFFSINFTTPWLPSQYLPLVFRCFTISIQLIKGETMHHIRIEGHINDANTGEALKDIQVDLILDREILDHYLTGSDGKYLLKVKKARPGEYEIRTHESEGAYRYSDKEEKILIDTIPFQTQLDFSLL